MSEAQERMTVAVPPEKLPEFLELSRKMNVLSTVLGEFTDSGRFHVLYDGRTVGYLDMEFLHEGLPKMNLRAKWGSLRIVDEEPLAESRWTTRRHSRPSFAAGTSAARSMWCASTTMRSRVQASLSLTGRYNDGPADAGVVRPDLSSVNGVVISHGICPKYSRFDTYNMVACAIDEAIRNNMAAGGSLKRMALLDNFCWSDPVLSEKNPEGPYKLAQLVRANRALYDYTTSSGTPCISGKDMKNDYMHNEIKISVPQTVLVSCISVIDDVEKAVTMDMKDPGDLIVVIGRTYGEMGGASTRPVRRGREHCSPCAREGGKKRPSRPWRRPSGRVSSAPATTSPTAALPVASPRVLAGDRGIEVDLAAAPTSGVHRDDILLFSESASRFVVTIREKDLDAFKQAFRGVYGVIGKVQAGDRFQVKGLNGSMIIDTTIGPLKEAWQAPFKEMFE